MFTSFRRWLESVFPGGGARRPIVNRFTQSRLIVETLEDRVVPASVGFSTPVLTPTVYPGGLVAVSTVTLTDPSGPTVVQYATSDGTATAGTDYSPTYGILFFQPGQTSQQIDVPILGPIGDPNNTFQLTLSSPFGATLGTAAQTVTFTVANPVSLTNLGSQSNYDGDTVSLATTASDALGNALTYSDLVSGAHTLPPGLTINASTGVIAGTVASNADASGPYLVTITATDSAAGVSVSEAFIWAVSPVTVLLADSSSQVNFDGDSVNFAVNSLDAAGNALTYSAVGLPSGLSINAGTGVISGAVSASADSSSPYETTITATDSVADVSSSEPINWAILANSVSVTAPGGQLNSGGDTVDLVVVASNPAGHALTFTASGLPDGLTIDSQSGIISGTIASDAVSSTPYSVTVIAADSSGGAEGSAVFTWTVSQFVLVSPAAQTNFLGDTVGLPVQVSGVASDATFCAQNLPDGLSINSTTGVISGTIAADAAAGSPYSVTVSIAAGGVTASQTFIWNVNAIVISTPRSPANETSDSVSLTITATAAYGDPVTYSATGLPDGLTINSSSGVISGTVAADAATTSSVGYSATVTATDSVTGATAQASFQWDVFPALTTGTVQYFPLGAAIVISQGQAPQVTDTRTSPFVVIQNGAGYNFRWILNQASTAWSLEAEAPAPQPGPGWQPGGWRPVTVAAPPNGARTQGLPQGWGWSGGILYIPAGTVGDPPPIPQAQQPAPPQRFLPIPNNQTQAQAARRVLTLLDDLPRADQLVKSTSRAVARAISDVFLYPDNEEYQATLAAALRDNTAALGLYNSLSSQMTAELRVVNSNVITTLVQTTLPQRAARIQRLAHQARDLGDQVAGMPASARRTSLSELLSDLRSQLRGLEADQNYDTSVLRSTLRTIINSGN